MSYIQLETIVKSFQLVFTSRQVMESVVCASGIYYMWPFACVYFLCWVLYVFSTGMWYGYCVCCVCLFFQCKTFSHLITL